jgi:hypothetical protein
MPSKKDGGRRKKIMDKELKMVDLKPTSKDLAIVFSHEVKDNSLKGSYFLASVFSSDPATTEVFALPDPLKVVGVAANTLHFQIKIGLLHEGDLIVVTFPAAHSSVAAEDFKRIEADLGVKISQHSIKATVGGESADIGSWSEGELPESIEIYDPCIEPENLAWEGVEKAAKELKETVEIDSLKSVLKDLKKAHECEDSRESHF